jgi:chromosome segregation ATPase
MTKGYCLNELQQIVEVEAKKIDEKRWEILTGELTGIVISKDFFYSNKEKANAEIADRHHRLHEAFKGLDLLKCLSINKEPHRKMEGKSKLELEALALEDRKSYKNWLSGLEKGWEEINHERPDLEKLSKTLKNANLIQRALENPLAIEFIEIMAKEAQIRKARKKMGDAKDIEPTP